MWNVSIASEENWSEHHALRWEKELACVKHLSFELKSGKLLEIQESLNLSRNENDKNTQ